MMDVYNNVKVPTRGYGFREPLTSPWILLLDEFRSLSKGYYPFPL